MQDRVPCLLIQQSIRGSRARTVSLSKRAVVSINRWSITPNASAELREVGMSAPLRVVLLSLLLLSSSCSTPTQPDSTGAALGTVERVVDGDTVILRLKGRRTRVRLIGVDAPETTGNDRAHLISRKRRVSLAWLVMNGRAAKDFVSSKLPPDSSVRIEYDRQRLDRYGRTLGYVYTSEDIQINEELLYRGLAWLYVFPPNMKYAETFRRSEYHAQVNRLGVWKK